MKLAIFALILFCSGLATPVLAVELSSLQPAVAAPGGLVTLGGNDWPEDFRLLIGEAAVSAERLSASEVRFRVPELPPGDYAISVASEGRKLPTTTSFILKVLDLPPLIDSVTPEEIPFCSGLDRQEIVLIGRNFAPGATPLLDDSALAVKSRSQGSITVLLPSVPAGLHKLQVVNPDGQKSMSTTLSVDQRPVIENIEIGTDQVVTYPIRIIGKNFSPHSKLILNGTAITNRSDDIVAGNDRITYLNCTTLLYQRYPVTGQAKDLTFQVLNSDGQVSNVVTVSAN